jgi:hypothetical protein
MQENMRFALEYVKSDLRSAGRLSIVNGIEIGGQAGSNGRDPRLCPLRSGLRAIELIEDHPETPQVLTRFRNNLRPDRLRLLVDRSEGITYTLSRLNGRNLLMRQSDQRTPDARRNLRRFMHFSDQALVHIVSPSGQSDLVAAQVRSRDDDRVQLTLDTDLCPSGDPSIATECAPGGCIITPVQAIEYAVVEADAQFALAPQEPDATFLVRRVLSPQTLQPTDVGIVLAPYAVDFQVWATYDTRNEVGLGGNLPRIPVDPDPTDDKGNWVTESESEIMNSRPHRIRGLAVMLGIRTPREDQGFKTAPDRDLPPNDRLAADRTWFELNDADETGFARVMTMQTEVETPNMYRGN